MVGRAKGLIGLKKTMNVTGVGIIESHSSQAAKSPSREDVHRMFGRIARRYDLLNRMFSLGQDVVWRKKVATLLAQYSSETVLDLATGTADVLLMAFKHNHSMRFGMGIDLSGEMLEVGRRKIERAKLSGKTILVKADALSLPIADNSFDATTIAFGIRNVMDVDRALKEMRRVLKTGGKSFILEFALPINPVMRRVFLIYLRSFIPLVGGIVSGDKRAYKYFDETVESFSYGEDFVKLMNKAGFKDVKMHRLTFGVAMIYEGTK